MKNFLKNLWLAGLLLLLSSAPAHAAKMALSPGSAEFKIGCVNALNIILNTEGADTRAVDAFLSYNPDEIEIIDQVSGAPGTQLRAGSIYQSYPGNRAENGTIRMTAFNENGFFNGRGILASLIFKSKPGVEQTSISFQFAPGSSTDSNVANPESVDVLNGAYGGIYTFRAGPCTADSSPPWVEDKVPDNGDMNVPLDSNIEFVIKDNHSGVDLDSLRVNINDITYTKDGENRFNYQGRALKYKIIIDPDADFLDRVPIKVKINAQDFEGNIMPEVLYSFNELMSVSACQCEPCLELRPAAPYYPYSLLLFLLILLALSLLLNIDLLMEQKKKETAKVKFARHRISRQRKR